jgi:hypothetical protein
VVCSPGSFLSRGRGGGAPRPGRARGGGGGAGSTCHGFRSRLHEWVSLSTSATTCTHTPPPPSRAGTLQLAHLSTALHQGGAGGGVRHCLGNAAVGGAGGAGLCMWTWFAFAIALYVLVEVLAGCSCPCHRVACNCLPHLVACNPCLMAFFSQLDWMVQAGEVWLPPIYRLSCERPAPSSRSPRLHCGTGCKHSSTPTQ